MYKVIWLVKFQPDKPREEVLRWWRGRHAELAKITPGMLRYVQSYWAEGLDNVTQLPTGKLGAFDGHAEHWFESREAYEAALETPEWKETLRDGPYGFMDEGRAGGVLEETVITWDRMEDGRASP